MKRSNTRSGRLFFAGAAAIVVFSANAIAQQPATPTTPKQEAKQEKPQLYDESADAKEQIVNALKHAKRDHKRVLIQWGANWCGWCYTLDATFKRDRALAKTLLYEYELVHLDIGRWDKNLDLVEKYGADIRGKGVPYLTILDEDGKVIANQDTGSLEKEFEGSPGHDADAVRMVLEKHQADPIPAESVLNEALAEANKENKLLFVHYGAPWCGWCKRLEAWMEQDEVAKLMAKDFVDVKIDVDRMPGGTELLTKHKKGQVGGGIPWFAALNGRGEVVADSNDANGSNLGFPWTDEEIAKFETFLLECARNLAKEEVAELIESLREFRAATEQKQKAG